MAKFSRRGLLLAGGAVLLAGCGSDVVPDIPGIPDGADRCRTPESLVDFSTVGTGTLGYEIDRTPTPMRSDPAFLERLELWAEDWAALSGLGAIREVWSYGAYVDKCSSFHQAGRAFDFAEVVHDGGTISCRYDTWNPGTDAQLRDYWRLAASLHLHFTYTLTYLYNAQHHNHIHVDNSVSGEELSTFRQRSEVQVQLVQSALLHVHGRDVEVTGSYDQQTRDALRPVQQELGITAPLADAAGWQAFLRATASG
ncbi:extensin family protein [Tessaracoccus rhinocerotis]|uniref:Extensin family protein n=1 Tax=Tessaracoccus rhinocerotis TaxID=1689449 RepID=A0A553JWR2_9ACTN|nr:extensin family protein [Tessaracoccus rhinocerotis]TRY16882.1 extensin family protein [Tessaracoccus rhinocerotis]